MDSIKNYYWLAKPGIIYGNLVTTIAGFLLASRGQVNFELLIATLLGISLVIASGCVFNNYIDRNIDAKMARTKNRALVKRVISGRNALTYASILGIFGLVTLGFFANMLSVYVALVGLFFYVVMYSLWKRRSVYGTVIGSISGAVPPVVGYVAVTNNLDAGALILVAILVTWQMPHFYAIAIYRLKDYAAAGIPVLPVKRGIYLTKINMLVYINAFIIAALLLTFFGYTGYSYLVVAVLLGFIWLSLCIKGLNAKTDDRLWARKMFLFSLIVLTLLCVMISADAFLK